VSARRGFGDETWRLAQQGDAAALHRAAALLLQGDGSELDYDGHRARAFALAIEGRTADGLRELNEGWTEDWPFPAAYAADIARLRFLAGDYDKALDALQLSTRGADRIEPAVAELTPECVRRDRRLWTHALRVAVAGGTPWQRLRTTAAVVGARF
jgi:hypothetical protein